MALDAAFDKEIFHAYLLKGELTDAIQYLARFPEQAELHRKYISVFEREEYAVFAGDCVLNDILILYQKYYRDVFYLHTDEEKAADALKAGFVDYFGIQNPGGSLAEIEEGPVAEVFQTRGYRFLGGKTGGYWGPYIWQSTEEKTYGVELPEGRQPYTVRFLDGFLSKSWLDYISFGEIGTGGWTDGDGIIHCVKSAYDLGDESFTVSLLKHEAQHAMDLSRYSQMASEELEYRAKLVELIYSCRRNLLRQFVAEADSSKAGNGHSMAADRIAEKFKKRLGRSREEICLLPTAEIQTIARDLLADSNDEIKGKYGGVPL